MVHLQERPQKEAIDRHEYLNGVIRPMPRGTPTHNQILLDLAISLRLQLPRGMYQVFTSDQRLAIPDRNVFTYPDVMVSQKPIQLYKDTKDTVLNLLLIAEVLSPSTQNYDRGERFHIYQCIPSLKEYLLLEQSCLQVEYYCRQSTGQWVDKTFGDRKQKIYIKSLDLTVSMAEIYGDVDL